MSTIKKRPVSPRQKMINLMYIVLLAMLALNVSSDVLKGFQLVGDSLRLTTGNSMKENEELYKDFRTQLKANHNKVAPWYEKAMQVKQMSDSLYNLAEDLRQAIARETDGADGDPDNLQNKEDLNAAAFSASSPTRADKPSSPPTSTPTCRRERTIWARTGSSTCSSKCPPSLPAPCSPNSRAT